jgi:SAM-dependent methyltransferase
MGMLMYDALVLRRASQDIVRKESCLTLGVPTLNFSDQHYHDQVRGDVDSGHVGDAPFNTAAGFFTQLGFAQVSALDISDYEGADIVGDLNDPDLARKLGRQFDLVYDSGTIEHIFDAPAGLRSIAKLVRPGGVVVHATPCNGFVDHGFWQVSPDLYKAFYGAAGFDIMTAALFVFADTPYALEVTENLYRTKGRRYISANAAEAILVFAAQKNRDVEVPDVGMQDYYAQMHEGAAAEHAMRFFVPFGSVQDAKNKIPPTSPGNETGFLHRRMKAFARQWL